MPTGTPRPYKVLQTLHGRQRAAERGIASDEVEQAVRTGEERPLEGKGEQGGVIRRYRKRFPAHVVIVIAELVGEDCYVVTTYEESPDPRRN